MATIAVKKIVLGPEKGMIARIKNQYQYESLIKLDRQGATQSIFKESLAKIIEELQAVPEFRSVRWVVDVDHWTWQSQATTAVRTFSKM